MPPSGRFGLSSNAISAGCAVVSVIFTLPATISSCVQLNKAEEKISQAQAILDQTKQQSRDSSKNLAEMQRLASAGEGQLAEQKKLSELSNLQTGSMRANAQAAADLVQSSRELLNESRKAEELRARPSITFVGMKNAEMVQGRTPATFVLFSKSGLREPTDLSVTGSWAIIKSDQELPNPGRCSPKDKLSREFGNGSYRLSANGPLTGQQFEAVSSKQSKMIFFGRLCYNDGSGVRQQVNYCVSMHPDWTTRC